MLIHVLNEKIDTTFMSVCQLGNESHGVIDVI